MLPCDLTWRGGECVLVAQHKPSSVAPLLTLKAPKLKILLQIFLAERTAASPNQTSFFSLFFSFF